MVCAWATEDINCGQNVRDTKYQGLRGLDAEGHMGLGALGLRGLGAQMRPEELKMAIAGVLGFGLLERGVHFGCQFGETGGDDV